MPDNPRIEELRRRVQLDPASIAFAALAEEYRRAGQFQEAIAACKAGLRRHPAYLSAHVTLGRALIEVGEYEEAREELEHVLKVAPENLAAIRGLAEIHHRLGDTDTGVAQSGDQAVPPVQVVAPAPTPSSPAIAISGRVEPVREHVVPPAPQPVEAPRVSLPVPLEMATTAPTTSFEPEGSFEATPPFEPAAAMPLSRVEATPVEEPAPWEIPLAVLEPAAVAPTVDLSVAEMPPIPEPAPTASPFALSAPVLASILEPTLAESTADMSSAAEAPPIPEAPPVDPALPGLEAFLAAILRARSELDSGDPTPRA